MSSGTKFTPGPWEVDTIKSDGEYGDGGPDSRSGYDAYAVFDAQGRSLFDSLNRDGRVSEIHEDGPDEDGRGAAWDELARRDLTLAAAAPELYEALEILAAYPLEEFSNENKPDDQPLFGANNWLLTVGQVRAARKALAKARGEA